MLLTVACQPVSRLSTLLQGKFFPIVGLVYVKTIVPSASFGCTTVGLQSVPSLSVITAKPGDFRSMSSA